MPEKLSATHVEQLSQLLEMEKAGHASKRRWCLVMFAVSVFCLLLALIGVGIALFKVLQSPDIQPGWQLTMLQVVGPLAALAVSMFSTWWAVQNCLHSIDRALYAAKLGSPELFAALLDQVQCADQKKKKLWLEVVKSVVT
ncbi:MAG: hypothetical protein ABUS48_00175 [Pseudomonadota bacterium]